MNIEQIKSAIREKLEGVKTLAETVEGAARDFTADEKQFVTDTLNEIETLENQKKELEGDAATKSRLTSALERLGAEDAKELNDDALAGATVGATPAGRKTLGEIYTGSKEYQAFKSTFPNGLPDGAAVKSTPVMVGGFKDLITSGNFDGIINPDQRGLIIPPVWGKDLKIRDLITIGQTSSDIVEYAKLTEPPTNNAAPVPEATTFDDIGSGDPAVTEAQAGLKPFSEFQYEKVTESVSNIAHLVAATRRSLSDAGQLLTTINTFLRWGLDEEVEDQIVSGDGTGENFTGILNASGVQVQAFDTSAVVSIRKAMTKAVYTGRVRPNGVAMNPIDDEALDLLQDGNERYYGGGPFGAPGPSTIWGLPRVVSESIPQGTAVLGDWRQAVMWDREQTSIMMTEAHKDWFARNLVAVRAELRAAFGLLRPAGFVKVSLSA